MHYWFVISFNPVYRLKTAVCKPAALLTGNYLPGISSSYHFFKPNTSLIICQSYQNIQIPEQLLQNPARAFLQEERREDSQKLFKKRARLDQRKNFFPVKIVGKWNDLPANVVEAATIGSFKRRLMNHQRSIVTS